MAAAFRLRGVAISAVVARPPPYRGAGIERRGAGEGAGEARFIGHGPMVAGSGCRVLKGSASRRKPSVSGVGFPRGSAPIVELRLSRRRVGPQRQYPSKYGGALSFAASYQRSESEDARFDEMIGGDSFCYLRGLPINIKNPAQAALWVANPRSFTAHHCVLAVTPASSPNFRDPGLCLRWRCRVDADVPARNPAAFACSMVVPAGRYHIDSTAMNGTVFEDLELSVVDGELRNSVVVEDSHGNELFSTHGLVKDDWFATGEPIDELLARCHWADEALDLAGVEFKAGDCRTQQPSRARSSFRRQRSSGPPMCNLAAASNSVRRHRLRVGGQI